MFPHPHNGTLGEGAFELVLAILAIGGRMPARCPTCPQAERRGLNPEKLFLRLIRPAIAAGSGGEAFAFEARMATYDGSSTEAIRVQERLEDRPPLWSDIRTVCVMALELALTVLELALTVFNCF
ncbi:hypothetical protein SAMN05444162_3002 [Paenibacillaceae bacterium GAS479]|nr:hypothetical protein SAMN05444162_3002 [Paenibacillaceae bacterium GAS479]